MAEYISNSSEEKINRVVAEVETNTAWQAAQEENARREMAEADAEYARSLAYKNEAMAQNMARQRDLMSANLAAERDASSSTAFGYYLMLGIVVALLIVGGVYFYSESMEHQKRMAYGSSPIVTNTTENVTVKRAPAYTYTTPR